MAQSTIELPDPLEGSAGVGYAGADDLLAQLAGEEVDRLLSDAESGTTEGHGLAVETNRGATPAPADEQDEARETREKVEEVAGDDLTATALDELFDQINAGATPTEPSRDEGALREREAGKKSALNKSIGPVSSDESVGMTGAGEVSGSAVASDPDWEAFQEESKVLRESAGEAAEALKLMEPPSVADALAAEMEEDERLNRAGNARTARALEMPGEPEVIGEGAIDAPAAELVAGAAALDAGSAVLIDEALAEPMDGEEEAIAAAKWEEEGAAPILVRILEWINAPLSGLSEGVRAALGKVAIVTTLNATAVLIYVLMFRKHP